MIFDIRGTHGSGKSWVVRQILDRLDAIPIVENGVHLGYHLPPVDAAVLGRYETECGGCDGIKTADEVVRRVRVFHGRYRHVLLEGILVSHTFKRYAALAKELGNYTFFFLDTPLNSCVARVKHRRREAGNHKPLDPKNVVKDWHGVWERVRGQCVASGLRVEILDHSDPIPPLLERLKCHE